MGIPPLFNQPVGFHRDPSCHGASRASRAMGRRSRGLFVAVVQRSKPWENHRKTIGKWWFNGSYSWFMIAKLVSLELHYITMVLEKTIISIHGLNLNQHSTGGPHCMTSTSPVTPHLETPSKLPISSNLQKFTAGLHVELGKPRVPPFVNRSPEPCSAELPEPPTCRWKPSGWGPSVSGRGEPPGPTALRPRPGTNRPPTLVVCSGILYWYTLHIAIVCRCW